MPAPRSPAVACELLHPTLIVSDLGAAVAFYTHRLGFTLGFTWGDPPSETHASYRFVEKL